MMTIASTVFNQNINTALYFYDTTYTESRLNGKFYT